MLRGQGGDDTLNGGLGTDQLHGDGGRDTFIAADSGAIDIIHKFQRGLDKIIVSEAAFGAATPQASFSLVLENGINYLYYDADGAGPGGSIKIIGIQGGAVDLQTDVTTG